MQQPNSINPARVDFTTLRLFCAVATAGSITKGAEMCHLALSAASRRLSEFEVSTGSALLQRTAQGVSLTDAGRVALQHAIRLFQGFEQFSSEIKEYSRGARGHVRLWANMSALTEFVPDSLAAFMREYPDIRVEIEEQLSGDIVRALVEGLADVGVFAEGTPVGGLDVETFRIDELVVACARDHPLASLKRVSFRDCLSFDLVGLNRGSSLLGLIYRAAESEGIPLRLRVQVRSFDAMCQMIGAKLGIGILPLAACRPLLGSRKLKAVRLADAWAHRKLLVATKSSVPLTSASRLLLDYLREPARSPSSNSRSLPIERP